MQLGMIGLAGWAEFVRRLMIPQENTSIRYAILSRLKGRVAALAADGLGRRHALEELVAKLAKPRTPVMLPPERSNRETIDALQSMSAGRTDVIIDGGNTFWQDDVRRGRR